MPWSLQTFLYAAKHVDTITHRREWEKISCNSDLNILPSLILKIAEIGNVGGYTKGEKLCI
jgi:hypothetical protein